MRTLKIDLTEQSIDAAIKYVKEAESKINEVTRLFLGYLAKKGARIAKANVVNIDSGATKNSIKGMIVNGNKAVIMAGENAIWLEFGTGVYWNGVNGSYPEPLPDGIDKVGTHGQGHGAQSGWYYPTDDERYIIADGYKDDGKGIGYTHGILANRFMFQAKQMLVQKAPKWAENFFERWL